jgi:3-oxoacyl-[acyl-carrier protein] reductase
MILEGKVALITGGGRGIGKAIAEVFGREKADIIIADIDVKLAKEVANKIEELYRVKAIGVEVDVSNIKDVERMLEISLDNFNNINILINNAGITRDTLLIRMKEEDWQKVLEVNLTGVFNCIKVISRKMIKQNEGKIINISSVIGISGNIGQVNYAASKAGIIGLTKSVAKELASRNINVNAIAPGFIDTEMTKRLSEEKREEIRGKIPLNRFGTPYDVAELALFLASPSSDYITGQIIVIDGGLIM